MLASFTRHEKTLLLGLLGFVGLGTVSLPWFDLKRKTPVFRAGEGPGLMPAKVPTGIDAKLGRDGRIDLNAADEATLDTLPGIGPARAKAILDLRNQRGGFREARELDDVPGIGPVAMARLMPLVTVESTSASAAATGPPRVAAAGAGPSRKGGKSSTVPVNINIAGVEELESLKYIGPALAGRIVEHRSKFGPFANPEALGAVKGIQRRVLEANPGRIVTGAARP